DARARRIRWESSSPATAWCGRAVPWAVTLGGSGSRSSCWNRSVEEPAELGGARNRRATSVVLAHVRRGGGPDRRLRLDERRERVERLGLFGRVPEHDLPRKEPPRDLPRHGARLRFRLLPG